LAACSACSLTAVNGGAQLMRGVRDELALRIERRFQPASRRSMRRKRADFQRHIGFVDRFERRMRLAVQRVGQPRERIELAIDDAPDDPPARKPAAPAAAS